MPLPLIKIAGVSASGKSTLVRGLREAGYNARAVSQEHSHVPDLWRQFDRPHLLVYLNTELAVQQARRPDVSWTAAELAEERERLAHAQAHADLQINTAAMTPDQVLAVALAFLHHHRVAHSDEPLPPASATGSALAAAVPAPPAAAPQPRKRRRKRA